MILANRSARIAAHGETAIGLAAERLEDAWEKGRWSDAHLIASWLTEQGVHPRLVVHGIEGWTDHDWGNITDETGIPTPPSVRERVALILRGVDR